VSVLIAARSAAAYERLPIISCYRIESIQTDIRFTPTKTVPKCHIENHQIDVDGDLLFVLVLSGVLLYTTGDLKKNRKN
jgi:hypothetical protein